MSSSLPTGDLLGSVRGVAESSSTHDAVSSLSFEVTHEGVMKYSAFGSAYGRAVAYFDDMFVNGQRFTPPGSEPDFFPDVESKTAYLPYQTSGVVEARAFANQQSGSAVLHISIYHPVSTPPLGDVDSDGEIDQADITFTQDAVSGSFSPEYDHNLDGVLSLADVDHLIQEILGTRPGDTNLDRRVNFVDLLALASNYELAGTWQEGDFNRNGIVDSVDHRTLSDNYNYDGTSPRGSFEADRAYALSIVPEPTLAALVPAAALLLSTSRTRRRNGNTHPKHTD